MKKKVILTLFTALFITACSNSNNVVIKKHIALDYNNASWTWVENENSYSATLNIPVIGENYTYDVVGTVSAPNIIKEATCEEDGVKRYSATAIYDSLTFSDFKDIVIEKHGHNYTNVVFDDEYHWNQCECGLCVNKVEHTFGNARVIEEPSYRSRGIQGEECTCGYIKESYVESEEEWSIRKIARANQVIDYLPTMNSINDAYKFVLLDDAKEIVSLMSVEEIYRTKSPEKLLDTLYGFGYLHENNDAKQFYMEGGSFSNGYDETYGNYVNLHLDQDLEPYPFINDQLTGTDTENRSFIIYDFKTIPSYVGDVCFYVKPQINTQLRFKVFDTYNRYLDPTTDVYELEAGIWNKVVISSATLNNFKALSYSYLKIEFVGTVKAGDYQFSSFFCTKSSPSKLSVMIDKIPEIENIEPYHGGIINEAYAVYQNYGPEVRKLIVGLDKLLQAKELYDDKYEVIVDSSVSYACYQYPDHGVDYIETNYQSDYGPVWKLHAYEKTWATMALSPKTFNYESESAVFYVKGYNMPIAFYNGNATVTFSIKNPVAMSDGWYKYTLTSDNLLTIKNSFYWNTIQFRFNDPTGIPEGDFYFSAIYGVRPNVSEIIQMINDLPNPEDVTASDKEAIYKVYELYVRLSDNSRALVTNADRLLAIKQAFENKEGQFTAEYIYEKINSLPESSQLKPYHGSTIYNLYNSYSDLDNEFKSIVTNFSDLMAKKASYDEKYETVAGLNKTLLTSTSVDGNIDTVSTVDDATYGSVFALHAKANSWTFVHIDLDSNTLDTNARQLVFYAKSTGGSNPSFNIYTKYNTQMVVSNLTGTSLGDGWYEYVVSESDTAVLKAANYENKRITIKHQNAYVLADTTSYISPIYGIK